jgi:magnesium transporter
MAAEDVATNSGSLTVIEFDFDKRTERVITPENTRKACEYGLFCWIDVDAAADPAGARRVLEDLGVNRHCIDEALGPDSDGRHDLYDDCLHIAVTAVHFVNDSLVRSHVDIVIGERFIVTLRRGPVEFVEQVRKHYRQDFVKFAKTGSFLIYEYWDALIESYKKAMRAFEGHAERVQGKIFDTQDDAIFNEVAEVTRDLLSFRKTMLAAREVLNELASRRSPFISESTQPFLERMVGTLERLSADLSVERDILSETLNLYMGITSHRTNRIVSRLTVVSMVFLPLTFIVGVYGQNFENMPELKWEWGYFMVWGILAVIAVGLLGLMKWKKWW